MEECQDRSMSMSVGCGPVVTTGEGGTTVTTPVATYHGLCNDKLQIYWAWLAANKRLLKAAEDFNTICREEHIKLGSEWEEMKKKAKK